MFDAAVLPPQVPSGYDVAAGYITQLHGEAANIWTLADWHRASLKCRYLLPIGTIWTPFADPAPYADLMIQTWENLVRGLQLAVQPCAVALDVELRIADSPGANAYISGWRSRIRSHGYHGIVYSSYSGAMNLGTGPLWLGPPAHSGQVLVNGVVEIAQTEYLGYIDVDETAPGVPFFDTQPSLPPAPGAPPTKITTGARMIARTSTGKGYWIVDSTGAVFAYGDAQYHGGANTTHLNAAIVGIASTPDDGGYWLLGADGGVFAYGNAAFYGAPTGKVH